MNWLRSEDLKEEKVITTPRHYNTPEGGVLAPNRPIDPWSFRTRHITGTMGKRVKGKPRSGSVVENDI
jgi:hypothetical protein